MVPGESQEGGPLSPRWRVELWKGGAPPWPLSRTTETVQLVKIKLARSQRMGPSASKVGDDSSTPAKWFLFEHVAICMFLWEFPDVKHLVVLADIASLTPLFSWLKGVPPGIWPCTVALSVAHSCTSMHKIRLHASPLWTPRRGIHPKFCSLHSDIAVAGRPVYSLHGLLLGVLYWVEDRPRIGSSLTSGGSLRRKTPCLVCHPCTTIRS